VRLNLLHRLFAGASVPSADILDTAYVSVSRHEHDEQAVIPYTSEYVLLVRIPRHILQLFMSHGRKGEVVFVYVYAAVVALENLRGA